ncbi:MAG: DUF523 domain-containing protein [Clostridia bacterium]|nr:DUF523 domain-containing protein [Clostridia bacterium]
MNMNTRERVLVSQCLLGIDCRYDGGNNFREEISALMERCEVIPVCPEVLGGLTTPRLPSERLGGRVVSSAGDDVTDAFARGAQQALRLAKLYGAKYAVLKQSSPSCGTERIYDGTFSGKKIPGMGVTAELFEKEGIELFDEKQINELIRILEEE